MQINTPFTLPCGAVMRNRICKAAMTEGLADPRDNPTVELQQLYQRWSQGGAGMLMSGNIMVDRRYLERGGNMVLDYESDPEQFQLLAKAGQVNGNGFWLQLSHPGRQCTRLVNSHPISPSDVQLKLAGNFARPRAMTEEDIEATITAFARSAVMAKAAGFTGAQIHSAHGYLGSQFLSPITNHRTDRWGGKLENRARFLLETVRRMRAAVGKEFPLSVKLNSADFLQGGFELSDCQQVAHWLGQEGIDLLEISGGTFESLVFLDNSEQRESTVRREAFFLEYAQAIRDSSDVPLMITGGFRHLDTMEDALSSGATDMIGIARPFCVDPDFPKKLFDGSITEAPRGEQDLVLGSGWRGPRSHLKLIKAINNQGQAGWFYQQIIRLAKQQPLMLNKRVLASFIGHTINEIKINKRREVNQAKST